MTSPDVGPSSFPQFSRLPLELRETIWHASFVPRVVVLYRRRAHYADSVDLGNPVPIWQSRSTNPAALQICHESRIVALRFYGVVLRLGADDGTRRIHRPESLDPHRRLYLASQHDTLAILGEFSAQQTGRLLRQIQMQDRHGSALKRLALSARSFAHPASGTELLVYGRSVLQDLEQLTLFLYGELEPPASWTDGECYLVDCNGSYQFRRYKARSGAALRSSDGKNWMTIGQQPLRIMNLQFGPEPLPEAIVAEEGEPSS